MKRFFVFAGEASGDLHASRLIRALKAEFSDCSITAVAGPRMREEGLSVLMPMENFEVMGFTDVLYSFPRLWSSFRRVREHILQNHFDAVILVDYPGFNLRLAGSLRKKGFKGKIVQYISPSVWAHGQGRIQQMAATLDLLLTIYPFEKECFARTLLPVSYVGNPLVEYVENYSYDLKWRQMAGLLPHEEFIAIFPGSRKAEIQRNLPIQLRAARNLQKKDPSLRIVISCSHPFAKELIDQDSDLLPLPRLYTYEAMKECKTALAKSGTITLELALHECPTVVSYQLTRLNKFFAQHLLRVNLPHYCIVNILGKSAIFPEFFESTLPEDRIFKALEDLNSEGQARKNCIDECRRMKKILGSWPSSFTAAKAIGALFR